MTQNFNGIGVAATAALPTGWRIDKHPTPRTVGTYSAASAATSSRAGAAMGAVTNSIYNFGAGVASSQSQQYWLSSSDRSPGWFGTGATTGSGGTKSGNLYVQLQAPSNLNLRGLDVSYSVEQYRAGTSPPGYAVQLFWSADGVSWTNAGAQFRTVFAPDTAAGGFDPAPGSAKQVPTTRLTMTIAAGSTMYLAWNYTVDSTTSVDFSNAIALGMDDITVRGVPAIEPFVVWSPEPEFEMPAIVLPTEVAGKSFDWGTLSALTQSPSHIQDQQAAVRDAIQLYLQAAVMEMTGHAPAIVNDVDPTSRSGIVFTTLDAAPPEIRNDPDVQAALAPNGPYGYENYEAFFIRSTPTQLLVVSNNPEGWVVAVPELLESVGYETLSYGPTWTTRPDYTTSVLVFQLERSGRPGYFYRYLAPGGSTGHGTVWKGAPLAPTTLEPGDEFLQTTMARFRVGTRSRTSSVPRYTGDGGSAFYSEVVAHIRNDPEHDNGFLNATTGCGTASSRPLATDPSVNAYDIWIDSDTPNVYVLLPGSGGTLSWQQPYANRPVQVTLDITVEWVRRIMLEAMKTTAEDEPGTHRGFRYFPNRLYEFNAQPADGGTWGRYAVRFPNWYTSYRSAEGDPLSNEVYALNGYEDHLGRSAPVLNHTTSTFDPDAATDHLYGLADWLLREYDKYAECDQPGETNCLPAGDDDYSVTPAVIRSRTSSGISKKSLIRAGLQSYNWGDVIPGFNLDPRVMISVAGYAKNRGSGDWQIFASHESIGRALQELLPNQPIANYELVSMASAGGDMTMAGAVNSRRSNPLYWAKKVRDGYTLGSFRAFHGENDFNGGKLGLAYYLMFKAMYNPQLSDIQLSDLINHWTTAAYGAEAAPLMGEYYDIALSGNQIISSPNLWAQAINKLDLAAQAATAPQHRRRLDDLKQHWYHYYLVDTGFQAPANATDIKEIAWKGQMAYQISARIDLLMGWGPTFNLYTSTGYSYGLSNPFHFTSSETSTWWDGRVKNHWTYTPVTHFTDVKLSDNQTYGSEVDLDDLVMVSDFGSMQDTIGYYFNGATQTEPTVLTVATEAQAASKADIGFKLYWVDGPGYKSARRVNWGLRRYVRALKTWENILDKELNGTDSYQRQNASGATINVVEVRYPASIAGVYEFTVGKSANQEQLVDLNWDEVNSTPGATSQPLTFNYPSVALAPGPKMYFYIPKGMTTLHLEEWDPTSSSAYVPKEVWLFGNLTGAGTPTKHSYGTLGTKTDIMLSPGQAGALAACYRFPFPYFYNIPTIWAKSPAQLLVPRKIAEIDGLTIVGP